MIRAVYPGSFDPITFGHLDIIQRILPLYDEVIVLVAQAEQKQYFFSGTQRVNMIANCLAPSPKLKIECYSGLTIDFVRQIGAQVIVRGLRAVSDYEYELAMANMNHKLAPEIETMIVFTRPEYNYVSSRMVKEVAINGGSLQDLVPEPVVEALRACIREK
jgi:pantetheine-phosphate adenylyltransferase